MHFKFVRFIYLLFFLCVAFVLIEKCNYAVDMHIKDFANILFKILGQSNEIESF